jgi:hypothetical protein
MVELCKGIVQQDLTGVKMVSVHTPSFNIKPLIFKFSNLKGSCSLNRKKWFQRLKPKYVADQYMWGFSSKELIAKSPFTFIADIFPHFLLEPVL